MTFSCRCSIELMIAQRLKSLVKLGQITYVKYTVQGAMPGRGPHIYHLLFKGRRKLALNSSQNLGSSLPSISPQALGINAVISSPTKSRITYVALCPARQL